MAVTTSSQQVSTCLLQLRGNHYQHLFHWQESESMGVYYTCELQFSLQTMA